MSIVFTDCIKPKRGIGTGYGVPKRRAPGIISNNQRLLDNSTYKFQRDALLNLGFITSQRLFSTSLIKGELLCRFSTLIKRNVNGTAFARRNVRSTYPVDFRGFLETVRKEAQVFPMHNSELNLLKSAKKVFLINK